MPEPGSNTRTDTPRVLPEQLSTTASEQVIHLELVSPPPSIEMTMPVLPRSQLPAWTFLQGELTRPDSGAGVMQRLESAQAEIARGMINPAVSVEDKSRLRLASMQYSALQQRAENQGVDTVFVPGLIRQLLAPGSSTPSELLSSYAAAFDGTAPRNQFDVVERSLESIGRLSARVHAPLSELDRAILAGHLANGNNEPVFAQEAALLQQSLAASVHSLRDLSDERGIVLRQLHRTQDFLVELTKESSSAGRDAFIVRNSNTVQNLTREYALLEAKNSSINQNVQRQSAEFVLARARSNEYSHPDEADRILIAGALALPQSSRELVPELQTQIAQAVQRTAQSADQFSNQTRVEQLLLQNQTERALSLACDQAARTATARMLEHTVAHGGAIELSSTKPERLESGTTRYANPAEGRKLFTLSTAEGTVVEGVQLSVEAKQRLENVPEGYTVMLARIPQPVGHSAVTVTERRGRAVVNVNAVEYHADSSNMLVAEDVLYVRRVPESDRQYEIIRPSGTILVDRTQLTQAETASRELELTLRHSEAAQAIGKEGSALVEKLIPLQHLLQAGMEGKKTEEYVQTVRALATDLHRTYQSGELRQQYDEMQDLAAELRKIPRGAFPDELQKRLAALEAQIDMVGKLIESGAIEQLYQQVHSNSFNADTIGKWMKTHGVVLVCSISAGVLAAAAIPTGGATGVGAVALMSLASAAGGYAGGEVGKAIVSTYDDSMKADLQRLLTEQHYGIDDYLGSMGTQVGTGFVTSFVLIGAGSYLGNAARAASLQNTGFAPTTVMSRIVVRTSNELKRVDDLIEGLAPSARGPVARFARESIQEYYEEAGEGGFEALAANADKAGNAMAANILKGCAFTFSLLNCAKGPGLTIESAANVTLDTVHRDQSGIQLRLSYSGSVDVLTAELTQSGLSNYQVDESGVVRLTSVSDQGETVVREFHPTDEALFMRVLRARSTDANGRSALDDYGLVRQESGEYLASQLAPTAKVPLENYLRLQGAIVERTPTGALTVRVGTETITINEVPRAQSSALPPPPPAASPLNEQAARYGALQQQFVQVSRALIDLREARENGNDSGFIGSLLAPFRQLREQWLVSQSDSLRAQMISVIDHPYHHERFRELLRVMPELNREGVLYPRFIPYFNVPTDGFRQVLNQELVGAFERRDFELIHGLTEQLRLLEQKGGSVFSAMVRNELRSEPLVQLQRTVFDELQTQGAEGLAGLIEFENLQRVLFRDVPIPHREIDAAIVNAGRAAIEQSRLDILGPFLDRAEGLVGVSDIHDPLRNLVRQVISSEDVEGSLMLSSHSAALRANWQLTRETNPHLINMTHELLAQGRIDDAARLFAMYPPIGTPDLRFERLGHLIPQIEARLETALLEGDSPKIYGLSRMLPEGGREVPPRVQRAAENLIVDRLRNNRSHEAFRLAESFGISPELRASEELQCLAADALSAELHSDRVPLLNVRSYVDMFGIEGGGTPRLQREIMRFFRSSGYEPSDHPDLAELVGTSDESRQIAQQDAALGYVTLLRDGYNADNVQRYRETNQLTDGEITQAAEALYIDMLQTGVMGSYRLWHERLPLSEEFLNSPAVADARVVYALRTTRDPFQEADLARWQAAGGFPEPVVRMLTENPSVFYQQRANHPEYRELFDRLPWAPAFRRLEGVQAQAQNQEHDPWRKGLPRLISGSGLDPMNPADAEVLVDFVARFGMNDTPRLFEIYCAASSAQNVAALDPLVRREIETVLGRTIQRVQDIPRLLSEREREMQRLLVQSTPEQRSGLAAQLSCPLGKDLFTAAVGISSWTQNDDPAVVLAALRRASLRRPDPTTLPDGHEEKTVRVPALVRRELSTDQERAHIGAVEEVTSNRDLVQRVDVLRAAFERASSYENPGALWTEVKGEITASLRSKISAIDEQLAALDTENARRRGGLDAQRRQISTALTSVESIGEVTERHSLPRVIEELFNATSGMKDIQAAIQTLSLGAIRQAAPEGQWQLLADALDGPLSESGVRGIREFYRGYLAAHYFAPDGTDAAQSFSPKVLGQLRRLWGMDDLDAHPFSVAADRLRELEEGITIKGAEIDVSLVPTRDLGLVYSGDLGDACYSSRHLLLAQGSYPGITSYTIVTGRGTPQERIVGSVLAVETQTTYGDPVLLIRANNPQKNFLSKVDPAVLTEGIIERFADVARARGIRYVAVPNDQASMSCSNRTEIADHYQQNYQGTETLPLVATIDTMFNGYPNFYELGMSRAVVVRDLSTSPASVPTTQPE